MRETAPVPARKPLLSGDLQRWALVEADSLRFLRELPDACVDAVVTDPPYGIGMAGKAWDSGRLTDAEAFTAWSAAWAGECLRLLKPGGYLAAFGAPRTFHRLAVGVEQAGFEIRDQLLWMFTSGVPKSRRLDGDRGTTLKPAYEPILLARRPFTGTTPENLALHGTGALNLNPGNSARSHPAPWPANVVFSHLPACSASGCAGACPVAQLDQVRPERPLSRYFYCPKASTKEREAGCGQLPAKAAAVLNGRGRAPRRNVHPTVKPVELMRWLVGLTCPVGGLVLDPFTGSGSTGIATIAERRQFFGMEREPGYAAIACARLAHWAAVFAAAPERTPKKGK